MTPVSRRALLLLAPAITLASCTDGSTQPDPASSSTTPTPPSPTALDGVPIQSDGGGEDEPMPTTANEDTEDAAREAALATMQIWVQGSSLDEQSWRKKLNATLTPNGQDVAQRRWGYTIKDREVVGNPTIIRANAATAVLHVTTDYTTYEVTVVRTDDGTWKTSNLTTDLQEGADQ
ncbi:hypothetical protein GCM10028787_31680 [Brachybacterium horti]